MEQCIIVYLNGDAILCMQMQSNGCFIDICVTIRKIYILFLYSELMYMHYSLSNFTYYDKNVIFCTKWKRICKKTFYFLYYFDSVDMFVLFSRTAKKVTVIQIKYSPKINIIHSFSTEREKYLLFMYKMCVIQSKKYIMSDGKLFYKKKRLSAFKIYFVLEVNSRNIKMFQK